MAKPRPKQPATQAEPAALSDVDILAAWTAPAMQEHTIPLSTGRMVKIQIDHQALMREILSGEAHAAIMSWVVWDSVLRDKATPEERTQYIYEAQLIFISRYLTVPRLLLSEEDDLMWVAPAQGEVGPLFFHPKEVDEIYNFIQRRLVPSPDTAPFPTVVPVPLAPATRQTLRNTRPGNRTVTTAAARGRCVPLSRPLGRARATLMRA